MSTSSLDTDFDLCGLEIASVMSSPESQRVPLAPLHDDEFHPEQLDVQGGFALYLPLPAV